MGSPENRQRLAKRWTVAQSWWIASELCRRDSTLRIDQDYADDARRLRVSRDLPRDSGGMAHVTLHPARGVEGLGPAQWTTWPMVFGEDNPHAWVNRIESKFGWAVGPTPATTTRSLTYRLIAQILTSTVNQRHEIHAISWNSMLGSTPHDSSWLFNFQGVQSVLTPSGRPQVPPLWVLFRGGNEGVIVLSESGFAYRRDGHKQIDLMARYTKRRLLDDVLRDLLPPLPKEG
ncbi:hypothetical protein [Curtobacterium sp. PhB78]|uniref:TY-Chap2 family putative peptide chaperone n=1 Tax=Curtobacterium sp. PhB78 TaxID=2485102 RepID=UPI000FB7D07C|nr:hypothetical protein EDF53_0981 [Curtobacterium sp. PhB78]